MSMYVVIGTANVINKSVIDKGNYGGRRGDYSLRR